jgi:hypothetical protein
LKKKFITYGSNAFIESSKRIIEEAKSLEIFDEFIRYSEENLPSSIKNSPLFLSKKGGGYWLWKPFVIYNALIKSNEGDMITYVDCGSKIFKSSSWLKYFETLESKNAVFFQYRDDFDYGWNKFCERFADSPKLKHWIKKSAIDEFTPIFNSENDWLEKNKLWAGFLILKNCKETRDMIGDWLNTMLYKPHLAYDLLLSERESQKDFFSENRYDQTILTIAVRYYEKFGNLLILNEEAEQEYKNQAVRATRKADSLPPKNIFQKILNQLK